MLYAAGSPDLCWWCASRAADSREHKHKRSDLVRQFGPGPYPELVSQKEDKLRNVQGPNSVLVKFRPTMCSTCNNERSQPFDLAYDEFTAYLHEHERHVLASRSIDLRAIYPRDEWELGRDGLLRYMAKHVGCRLAENGIEVPETIRDYLDGGPEPIGELSWEWEIRADIARATKKELAEGNMWLGDIFISQTDADDRALIVESHYGYRWFRVAWAVGSDLHGYPWPFRSPVQSLPPGPEPPPDVEGLLPQTAFLSRRPSSPDPDMVTSEEAQALCRQLDSIDELVDRINTDGPTEISQPSDMAIAIGRLSEKFGETAAVAPTDELREAFQQAANGFNAEASELRSLPPEGSLDRAIELSSETLASMEKFSPVVMEFRARHCGS